MNKKKKQKQKKGHHSQQHLAPPQILQRFKSLVASTKWVEALFCYRNWINRTGNKADAKIEGEILFRCASQYFRGNDLKQALQSLDEALVKDPENAERYNHFKAVCLAKTGLLKQSFDIFDQLNDEYHTTVLSYFIERGLTPQQEISSNEMAIEKSIANAFWKGLKNFEATTSTNPALKNISNAYKLFSEGNNPDPPLNLLKKKAGFERLASDLMLIWAVSNRGNIKIRNIIKSNPDLLKDSHFNNLLRTHLSYLLNEEKYNEISAIDNILKENNIEPAYMLKFKDEMFFNLAFEEIKKEKIADALKHFLEIDDPTPSVTHNIALCCQKLERCSKANEYWLKLIEKEKKPKRTDPEDIRDGYAQTIKYIAQNYLRDMNLRKALEYFKEALNYKKDDKESLESLVMIADDLDELSQSLQFSKRLFELEPKNFEYTILYALQLKHFGDFDAIIPLLQGLNKQRPDDSMVAWRLADSYLEKALEIRQTDLAASKNLMKKAKELDLNLDLDDNPKVFYLEGYFLYKAGKKKSAQNMFNKIIDSSLRNTFLFKFGVFFYEDGLKNNSIEMFKEITACYCSSCYSYFKMILQFLAKKDDAESAKNLCDFAAYDYDYHLADIVEPLLDCKIPLLAKEYSSMLIEEEDIDEDDIFLHLTVLNKIGESEETLSYAMLLYEDALENNDSNSISYYKQIIKQIEKRGCFKIA